MPSREGLLIIFCNQVRPYGPYYQGRVCIVRALHAPIRGDYYVVPPHITALRAYAKGGSAPSTPDPTGFYRMLLGKHPGGTGGPTPVPSTPSLASLVAQGARGFAPTPSYTPTITLRPAGSAGENRGSHTLLLHQVTSEARNHWGSQASLRAVRGLAPYFPARG